MPRADMPIEPIEIAQMVEGYVTSELLDADKYENRQPLDESGVYSLHLLAGRIYAAGFNDGRGVEGERERASRQRERDRARSRALEEKAAQAKDAPGENAG